MATVKEREVVCDLCEDEIKRPASILRAVRPQLLFKRFRFEFYEPCTVKIIKGIKFPKGTELPLEDDK